MIEKEDMATTPRPIAQDTITTFINYYSGSSYARSNHSPCKSLYRC